MKKSTETYDFDEIIVLTNEELTSNWSRLATLVRAYEKCTWDEAKAKALKMLGNDTAIAYIESVRKHPDGKPAEEPPKVEEEPAKLPRDASSVYHQNFKRLLKLAPGLVEKLEMTNFKNGEDLYGKSKVTGYQDWSLQVLQKIGDNFYIAIAHYLEQNGDLIPDPDMQLRLNLKNEMVEALEFQNSFIYKKVYDDSYKRKKVNLREQKNQNSFLTSWLLNLKRYGHKIKWRERKPDIADSELTIEYEKPGTVLQQPTPEPTQPIVEQPVIEPPVIEQALPAAEPPTAEKVKLSPEISKRLLNAIVRFDKIPIAEARKKADKLEENEQIVEYLLNVVDSLQPDQTSDLLKDNYNKLIERVPELLRWFDIREVMIRLTTRKKDGLPFYDFSHGADKDANTSQFAIYEKQKDGEGALIVCVNREQKTAWVDLLSDEFFGQEDYYDESQHLFAGEKEHVNTIFNQWLDYLVAKKFQTLYSDKSWHKKQGDTPENIEVATPQEAPEEREQTREEWLDEYKENAKKIPHFEPGQVQLTDRHIKAGVTQEVIDWINEHREGMVLKPRKGPMIHNTKNKGMDRAIHAKKPGMRISATGQIYYEGRSNRSDRRNTGL